MGEVNQNGFKKGNKKGTRPSANKKVNEPTVTSEITEVLEEIVNEAAPVEEKGEQVTMIDEVNLLVGDRHYRVVQNHRDAFQPDKFGERYSDVLNRYDYIVGDWGFEQLRLKGFFSESNRKAAVDQRIDTLEDYLYEFCNFGCGYFVVERIGHKKDRGQTPSKKQKRNYHKNVKKQGQPAHIEEKKTEVSQNKPKKKPVIKTRKPKETVGAESKSVKSEKTPEAKKQRNFVIRQKSES